jgi:hypothetical protein
VITVHFIDDSLTALGRLWYRGMQLTLIKGSEGWERTRDQRGTAGLT